MRSAPLAIAMACAAGALLLYQSQSASASTDTGGEADVASTGITDIFSSTAGDLIDMTNYSTAGTPSQNEHAFLDAIANSEVGQALMAITDDGYNVLVGATPSNPLTFSDYSTHPRIYNAAFNSTAAGRYQINWPTYQTLSRQTGLTDFSPATQDAMALQLIANKYALGDVDGGNIQAAMVKLQPVWRSLPGATGGVSGQRNNSAAQWLAWYQAAGGAIA